MAQSPTVLLLVLTILIVAPFGVLSANNTDCKGCFGNVCYDLTPLSQSEVTCRDSDGNTYFYQPCNPDTKCSMPEDPTPAVCQRDSKMPPNYHDCGSTKTVSWRQRTIGVDTGFILMFQGGTNDRQTEIEFVCDKAAGLGQFMPAVPTENPARFYHLKWISEYACPLRHDNTTVRCCNYANSIGQTLSTCTFKTEDCLRSLGDFDLVDSKATTSCNTCKEGPKQNWCCVYEKDSSKEFASKCIANGSQLNQCKSESGATLRGQFAVPNCADCFVTL